MPKFGSEPSFEPRMPELDLQFWSGLVLVLSLITATVRLAQVGIKCADGKLKDANNIRWYNSGDDKTPIAPATGKLRPNDKVSITVGPSSKTPKPKAPATSKSVPKPNACTKKQAKKATIVNSDDKANGDKEEGDAEGEDQVDKYECLQEQRGSDHLKMSDNTIGKGHWCEVCKGTGELMVIRTKQNVLSKVSQCFLVLNHWRPQLKIFSSEMVLSQAKLVKWTKEGLLEHIVKLIVVEDKV
ncbi:hypothetical protein F5148DRAFT_1370913 [Russula earlei]|uniref:Uncharacterized protein n=1 Tax=Russula earlei TaxID=71964 RepID=A0ACC0TUT4_9AGAM|nr:hypothetical protein F5148DRAFT_1370913 [Russula earlei]